ncbi:MAG: CRTAC1 family protein, partial [Planctomycetota bacterium]
MTTPLAVAMVAAAGCDRSTPTPPTDVKGHPADQAANASSRQPGWFTDVTDSVGLTFTHDAGIDGSYFYPQIMASGVALLDYDNDADLDVYVVNATTREDSPASRPRNRLFRQAADGSFEDVTASAGVGDEGFGMGVTVGDYDNDGHRDIFVTNDGPDTLYRNRGDGTFENVTAEAGIDNPWWACSASFLDYDLDGHLDLYVANYVTYRTLQVCADRAGRPEYCGPSSFPAAADLLLHNDGDGTFTDVSDISGVASAEGRGLGVVCEDFTGDGRPDVYVANDGDPNFLWVNNGDGTFTESAAMLGVALNAFGSTEASMGVTVGDADGDGDRDLFMTHLVQESNTFYRNDGTGSFDDQTGTVGLGGPSFPYTGFGTAFLDFDNDGDLDVAVANGRVKRDRLLSGADADHPLARYAEPNFLFDNDGSGTFSNVSDRSGDLCREVHVSRGLAIGDVDADGDLDVLISNCHGPLRLYRNDTPNTGHWLVVGAVDAERRRDAIGAWVSVTAAGRTQHRSINPGSSYASSSDSRAHFGLGPADRVEEIVVRWPDGSEDRFTDVDVDQVVNVRHARGRGATIVT